ncbi:PREDICTED: transmembrane protease serine 2-like [Cyprinodon variegatus]|uniref:transmembrane protease serine 2-like n=1 Tax=Cyprinodon variegatus TaxID=28743 RepID=UPI000742A324|nr:PREDICTED: transmembrane protease serine 2-like [Cyprinodon variegatus]
MITNPYLNTDQPFMHEDDKIQFTPKKGSDVKLQYVHHVSPNPPPEIGSSNPPKKDVKERWLKFTVAAVISLLLLLMVAGILLGYYYSSSCLHGMRCGDGNCVWDSEWCDGVKNCPAGQDEANCVRVRGSNFLLEVYWTETKEWRQVCSEGWSDQQGKASCHDIGYTRDTYFQSGHQRTDSNRGFLSVKLSFNPQSSILQQLTQRSSCKNNSVVTVQCTDCGNRENSSEASGSQLASVGSWPWQVSLHVAGSHRCGGAIISPRWLITAAHCVSRTSSPADWAVYVGIVDPLGPVFNPAHAVSEIITHEGYNSQTQQNDVALMKLSDPLNTKASSKIRPVCLPNAGLNMTDPGKSWVTYYGPTANRDSSSLYLKEAPVSLIPSAECNSSEAYSGRISQEMLCATKIEAGATMCNPDSGGPLVSHMDGLWWLMGEGVWGEHCNGQNKPGVYTSIRHHLDWIYYQMQKHQDA